MSSLSSYSLTLNRLRTCPCSSRRWRHWPGARRRPRTQLPAVVRLTVLQAVYDAAYRSHGDGHAPITLAAATDRIARYLEEVDVSLGDDPTAFQVKVSSSIEIGSNYTPAFASDVQNGGSGFVDVQPGSTPEYPCAEFECYPSNKTDGGDQSERVMSRRARSTLRGRSGQDVSEKCMSSSCFFFQ